MTPQEQEMIQGLIDRVNQTQLPEKDSQAEQLLTQTLGRNPDALYILAQTVLVQKYALDQAQKQLADLKAQLDHARQQPPQTQQEHHTSFLSSLLGRNDPPPPPPPPPVQGNSQQYAPVPNYAPSSGYAQAQPGYAQAQPQSGGSIFGGGAGAPQSGGFLRSALQTATGVAAGALAFQGIESLMHGFGGGGGGFGGGGQGFGNFGGGGEPREEVINNYYGDSGSDRGGDNNLSPDIEDRRNDSSSFSGNDNSDSFADTGNSGDDNSSFDSGDNDSGDSSSFDSGSDSSSFDSGGGDDSSFS